MLALCAAAAAVFAVLLLYSQTAAFAWDEGFHVLAAQLIHRGRTPYLDFCFPQPPGNAYWNAAWMQVLGESWRSVHLAAAMVATVSALLAAGFLRAHFPDPAWRLPLAVAGALLAGWNVLVIEYATLGQPYALCLFFLVAAWRVTIAAASRPRLFLVLAAGMLASAAAMSSLLPAAAVPILGIWIAARGAAPGRWRKLWTFLAGLLIPALPLLWLFARAPRTVLFNLLEYQLRYRRANWEDAGPHDRAVLLAALRAPQFWLLAILAAVAIRSLRGADPAWRRKLALCLWLTLGIGAELCVAHPTFEWYFVLLVPFVAVAAAAGLPRLCATLAPRLQPWAAVALVVILIIATTGASLRRDSTAMRWSELQAVARKVDEVTPPDASIWADEHIYFLTRRPPAEGTEFAYAEVADVPPALAPSLHIVALDELQRRAARGAFHTVSTCEETEQIEALDLPRLFARQAAVGRCHVFWQPLVRGVR